MKLYRLLLPCFMALGLCSCGIKLESVTGVEVTVEQKSRVTGDTFDLDDIKARLNYTSSSSSDISFTSFSSNKLYASCTTPSGSVFTLSSDFTLEQTGIYTINVKYVPTSVFAETFSGSDSFSVDTKIVKAESLTLSSDSMTLQVDQESEIVYSILPSDCTTQYPTFESSDTNVATVNEFGEVTGISEGQCIITATIDSIVKECLITVVPTSSIDYVFDSKKFTSPNGNWNYSEEGYSFDTRQNRGVCIDEEITITYPTSLNGIKSVRCDGYFSSNSIRSTSNLGTLEFYIDDNKQDSISFSGTSSSYNKEFKGNEKSGIVKIIISPKNNAKLYLRSVSIDVVGQEIYPTSVSLNGNDTIAIGESDKLTLSFTPANANMRDITWSSSNENILFVNRDGTIAGVKEGTAIINAKVKTESDYINASFEVTVIKIPVESINFDSATLEVYEGKSKKLNPKISPENASDKTVTYESSNPSIATVDASGNVTGMKIGECTITCKSCDNNTITASCKINVIEQPNLTSNAMSYKMKDYINKNFYSIDAAPSIGEVKLLVIPVWFTDSSTYISLKENVRSDIEKTYFGTSSDTGWESVKSYYETESGGKLTLTGTVSEWYECGKSMSVFNTDSNGTTTSNLVVSATDYYFSKHTSDSRKNYDNDGDGYIDGVILIYGAPDYSALEAQSSRFSRTSYGDNLWAYTYWLQNRSYKNTSSPGPNVYFWASYDFMYSSSTASTRTGKSSYGSGQNSNHVSLDSHTYIHEMGHIFGLEDYYDYSGKYNPGGGFSMQDYNVGGHDPFSCLALGWANAYVPMDSCEIELTPFQSSHEVILLSPSFNSYNSPFDEYLLLELYTPTGLNKFDTDYSYEVSYPRGVNATGIRLWHVDARLVTLDNRGNAQTSSIYTRPVDNCKFMMSNTYYSSSSADYISVCGKSYANYNLLQLIKNNTSATYQGTDYFKESSLFKSGSSFNMNTYKRQFVNTGKLNSNIDLGWSFSISIVGTSDNAVATVTINKD